MESKEDNAGSGKPMDGSKGESVDSLTTEKLENVRTVPQEQGGANTMDEIEKQPTQVSFANPRAFPDGGTKAWLCVAGGFCCMFCSFGWINCIGVFQQYYQNNQLSNYSPSSVAWIPSLEVFCMFFGGAPVGKLLDSYGPRWVLIVGTFMHVFGLMMASISYEYWHFILAQGLVSALGSAMIMYPAVTCCATWFHKRRALALGVASTGSSVGGIVFPIMIRHLIDSVGFGWSMRITAFLILGLMIFANFTLASRIPPKGASPWTISEFLKPFKELSFALVVLGGFFFFFGMFIPFNFLPSYGLRVGHMSITMSNYLVSILNGASSVGRILPTYIGDKVGRFNTMAVTALATGILVLALWIPSSGPAAIITFAALYGFATGAFVSLQPALIAQISHISEVGVRGGTMFATISVATLVGSPIGGALVTRDHGGYKYLQAFSGVCLMVGSVIFVGARYAVANGKHRSKV